MFSRLKAPDSGWQNMALHRAGNLYLALSGTTEQEHGWYKNLKPGESFTTVPAGAAVVKAA